MKQLFKLPQYILEFIPHFVKKGQYNKELYNIGQYNTGQHNAGQYKTVQHNTGQHKTG